MELAKHEVKNVKTKSLKLEEYMPRSELVTERVKVTKPRFPVIDVHTHFGSLVLGEDYTEGYDTAREVERFKEAGIKRVVNLELVWGGELDRLLEKIHPHEDFITTFSSVDVTRLDEPGFERYVRRTLQEAKGKGVRGLKFWKDLSLSHRDKSGKYIALDDPRLQVIWAAAAEFGLVVLHHVADPVAFFKPVDRYNERFEELSRVPEWSFYRPGLYTFEQLMEQQEAMIRDNPTTTFIIAHGGSYSEKLGVVSKWLDQYPNMYIDIAARVNEFGRQPYTARRFFERHQDRILFGTDAAAGYAFNYQPYFEFLETWNEYFDYSSSGIPGQGRWKIYGIGLGDAVLEKIYYKNAEKLGL